MAAIVTLTTDFGLRDSYAGAMKGVILSILPAATVIDITHNVPPQDVRHGAFVLAGVAAAFPRGTVHVAVVDPGVGTRRRAIAVGAGGQTFVGPDNGVLSVALGLAGAGNSARRVPLPKGARGVELTNLRFHLPRVSATFHGRDIFAPAAAHLANGVALGSLGVAIAQVRALGLPGVRRRADRSVSGVVAHVDGYGNLVTNIAAADLPKGAVQVTVAGKTIRGLSRNFTQGGPLLAIVGSYGLLEIAVRNGSAAQALGVKRGSRVTVRGK
ncbi:MAG: S-adenosyl-l-methionine hydroxide adenosyltransferase [Dehalococcoidia bacterium]|nr:S-adenosyl-l-methionine hydroxide adenosyltransferase [Dehalococcoidia bacterium]